MSTPPAVPSALEAFAPGEEGAVPIHRVTAATLDAVLASLPPVAAGFARAQRFRAKAGSHLALPGADGALAAVLLGEAERSEEQDPMALGALARSLPGGVYRAPPEAADPAFDALAWALGRYRFQRYRKADDLPPPRLVPGPGVALEPVRRIAAAVARGRDLINTPASDLGPAELAEAACAVGMEHGARVTVTVGDDLLAERFPLIHAVGRASVRAPRLVDLTWGDPAHPRVTLVGKGVVFDTGGLDIKPSSAMLLMKKDMGGAAAALAAAEMIMGDGLPVRLRLLLPIVENAIAGSALRPGDVLTARKGLTVEIGNTDAEGRLILADALALADDEAPDLLIDLATLTGAARVALGPELPALFVADDGLAAAMVATGQRVADPVWRLPLHRPYLRMLESPIADINNAGTGGMAGAITAALFLARFVEKAKAWAHLDIYGWNASQRPGRPEGGEPQGARLIHVLIRERYPRR